MLSQGASVAPARPLGGAQAPGWEPLTWRQVRSSKGEVVGKKGVLFCEGAVFFFNDRHFWGVL